MLKTEVFELARELGLPERIIDKKPSAGLYEGQTDEKEMGLTYKEIDSVLKGEIVSGPVFVKVMDLSKANEHKKSLPPVFSLGGVKWVLKILV